MSTPPNVSVAFTAEDRGISAAISSLSNQLKQLAVQQKEVAASATETAAAEESLSGSMHEAKGAAALLGEEVGVKLNRHLRGVLASSETLGPLLAAAFPIAAALGFTEVIIQAAEKMAEFISEQLIYTEDQKKAYEIEVEFNKEIIRHIDSMKKLNAEYERMGKSAVQVANIDVRDLNKALADASTNLEEVKKKLSAPLPEASFVQRARGAVGAMLSGTGGLFGLGGAGEAEKQVQADAQRARELEVKKAADAQEEVAAQLRNAEQNRTLVTQEEADKRQKARDEADAKLLAAGVRYLEGEQRLADEQKKLATEIADFWSKEQERVSINASKQLDTQIEADAKFRDKQKANAERAATDAIALQQREIERRAARGLITGAQETAQLKQLAQQKLDIENDYINAQIAEIQTRLLTDTGEAYAKDLEEYTALLEQKRAAQDRYNSETAAATDAGAKHLSAFATAQKSIAQNIGQFFTTGITQAKSFGDAFANLAKSIIGDLQKMAAEFVLTAIKKKLLGDTGGEGGGEGGGGLGGFLGGILGAIKFASGGPVTGPGGPKSDVIPAMLSSGEFVLNAEAVKALGQANLETLNMATHVPHLAAGGFVGGGGAATASEISMGIGLDEGLILRHLGSKAAGKVILQQLTNNSKGAQRALSRTD